MRKGRKNGCDNLLMWLLDGAKTEVDSKASRRTRTLLPPVEGSQWLMSLKLFKTWTEYSSCDKKVP